MNNSFWLGLIQVLGLWVAVVLIASKIMDWLFPRMTRGDKDEQGKPLDPLPWYPVRRPIVGAGLASAPKTMSATHVAASDRAVANGAYWRANLKLIGVLLVLWAAASILPVIASPWLNRLQILTGFPLGYYMGGQGSLIIFLGIVAAYVRRAARMDQAFREGLANKADPAARRRFIRICVIFIAFTGGFIVLVGLMALFEQQLPAQSTLLGWLMLAVSIGLYAVIGIAMRTRSLDEYLVAGRRVPAFFNGLAIAGDWMSAATFISMAGTLWLLGYEGLAYLLGWTGGYVLLAMLLAPYLRRFGQFTLPDFIGTRFDGSAARVVAAIIGVLISFTYVTAQVSGIGIIMSRFLGVNFILGVVIGLGSVLFCSFLGGMRAITWTQVAQCIVLLIAYLVPVTILSMRFTGVPLPQLMYGEALQHIVQLEALNGITNSYITPFNDWSVWNFLALMLCLMLGTVGMPHILIRFYTVPTPHRLGAAVHHAVLYHRARLCRLLALGDLAECGRQAHYAGARVGAQLGQRGSTHDQRSEPRQRAAIQRTQDRSRLSGAGDAGDCRTAARSCGVGRSGRLSRGPVYCRWLADGHGFGLLPRPIWPHAQPRHLGAAAVDVGTGSGVCRGHLGRAHRYSSPDDHRAVGGVGVFAGRIDVLSDFDIGHLLETRQR